MSDSISGSDPISGVTLTQPSAAPSISYLSTHSVPKPPPPPPPPPPSDTVTLSQAAVVNQMSGMGETPEVIALSLAIPLSQVNLDLGVTSSPITTAPTVAPVAAAAPVRT